MAAANLAGRTLADLIMKNDTDLVRLPWVGHRAVTGVLALVDRAELLTGRHQRRGDALISRVMG